MRFGLFRDPYVDVCVISLVNLQIEKLNYHQVGRTICNHCQLVFLNFSTNHLNKLKAPSFQLFPRSFVHGFLLCSLRVLPFRFRKGRPAKGGGGVQIRKEADENVKETLFFSFLLLFSAFVTYSPALTRIFFFVFIYPYKCIVMAVLKDPAFFFPLLFVLLLFSSLNRERERITILHSMESAAAAPMPPPLLP